MKQTKLQQGVLGKVKILNRVTRVVVPSGVSGGLGVLAHKLVVQANKNELGNVQEGKTVRGNVNNLKIVTQVRVLSGVHGKTGHLAQLVAVMVNRLELEVAVLVQIVQAIPEDILALVVELVSVPLVQRVVSVKVHRASLAVVGPALTGPNGHRGVPVQ